MGIIRGEGYFYKKVRGTVFSFLFFWKKREVLSGAYVCLLFYLDKFVIVQKLYYLDIIFPLIVVMINTVGVLFSDEGYLYTVNVYHGKSITWFSTHFAIKKVRTHAEKKKNLSVKGNRW